MMAALLLLVAGNAYAVITVGLSIENQVDNNGYITVINGSRVNVAYTVTEDTDNDLNKKDSIQLLRVDDDSVVASIKRGKQDSGTVSLKVKNSENEALYVRYIRKGSDIEIARTSHPADIGSIPLRSIPRVSLADLTIGLNAIDTIGAVAGGAVSINGVGFWDENSPDHEINCQWDHSLGAYSYYRDVGGATIGACDAVANIQLPQGRTVTGMSCTAYDNSGVNSNAITFVLYRTALTGGAFVNLLQTPASVDSTAVQQLSDTTINNHANATIDNSAYTYTIFASFSTNNFSNLGTNGRIYGCSVSYL
jgi:hypothetical protein